MRAWCWCSGSLPCFIASYKPHNRMWLRSTSMINQQLWRHGAVSSQHWQVWQLILRERVIFIEDWKSLVSIESELWFPCLNSEKLFSTKSWVVGRGLVSCHISQHSLLTGGPGLELVWVLSSGARHNIAELSWWRQKMIWSSSWCAQAALQARHHAPPCSS